jgi:hypothetical protein
MEFFDELAKELGFAVWSFARIEKVSFKYLKLLAKEDLSGLIEVASPVRTVF